MWSKIINVTLSLIIILGGIYLLTSADDSYASGDLHKDMNERSKENKAQRKQIEELENELEQMKQNITGLNRNINDYQMKMDELIENVSSSLPALRYSTEIEREALLFAKQYLLKNNHNGKKILNDHETILYLIATPTEAEDVIGVRIFTYQKQSKINNFPIPTEIRLGSLMTMQVSKEAGAWAVKGEINKVYQ